MQKTATFICGCGHSGTTLLANMFAAHPDIYVPMEETSAFLSKDTSRFLALMDEYRESGRTHLAEKTPRHVRVLPLIRTVVRGARFVLMVRDGRDVAASFIKRLGSAGPGIERWIDETGIVFSQRKAPDCFVLRYEDLIVDTEGWLRKICTFCGVPFHEAMLRYYESNRIWGPVKEVRQTSGAAGVEHDMLRAWQMKQPVFDGRGGWRGKLSEDDLAFFEAGRGKELMASFGYPLDRQAPPAGNAAN